MARILVVDDDAALRSVIGRLLQRAGHHVFEASDGREALRMVSAEVLDLVLTDINMPTMDGIELLLALDEDSPELPVIALSGGGRLPKETLLSSAGLLGAATTVEKPFKAADLLATVAEVLAGGGSESPSPR